MSCGGRYYVTVAETEDQARAQVAEANDAWHPREAGIHPVSVCAVHAIEATLVIQIN